VPTEAVGDAVDPCVMGRLLGAVGVHRRDVDEQAAIAVSERRGVVRNPRHRSAEHAQLDRPQNRSGPWEAFENRLGSALRQRVGEEVRP
jgi:hypothetical protein